jgi:iron complex outermembrane recepter protein
MRRSAIAMAICFSIIGISAAADGEAAIRKPTEIPAQRLETALQALAQQRDLQVICRTEVVGDLRTAGASGDLTTHEVLTQLLSGTGLTFRYLNENAITIVPTPAGPPSTSTEAAGADSDTSPPVIEEVVVTAQKRLERLIDTPQSVSVLTSDSLGKLDAVQFRDFANTVPGLNFTTNGAGYTRITMRGVTVGSDLTPTVSTYVDEVPYGSSSTFAGAAFTAPDFGLFDIDRIEVLRGPQGTLYGASSIGGLIKYVTPSPDTTQLRGSARTGITETRDGSVSYYGAASINVPIVQDKVALRASGFYSRDGGYVDNPTLGREDVNQGKVTGGRVDLLLTPTEALSLRIAGYLQDLEHDGMTHVDYTFAGDPAQGELTQSRLLPEPFESRFRLVSGTLTYDLGAAALTSVTSHQTVRTDLAVDFSALYVPLLSTLNRFYSTVGGPFAYATDKFTQEVRLASKSGTTLEWVIGGFYTDEDSEGRESFSLTGLAGQPAVNDIYDARVPSSYREHAVFGDLTWRITSRLDVTGGVRYAHNRQSFEQIVSGFLAPSRPVRRSSEDVVTYLGNARFHLNERANLYARYATGYRPGGPNFVGTDPLTGQPLGPTSFDADRLGSYEIGFKAETASRAFGIDAAVYFIDWNDVQISTVVNGFAVRTNAPGGATVRGGELKLDSRPIEGLTLSGAFAYQAPELSEANTALRGRQGERLPNVPRFTGTLNADYLLPIGGELQPALGTTVRYVADRRSGFDAGTGALRQYVLPEYTLVDLRAGMTFGPVDTQLIVRNLFDRRAQFSAFTTYGLPYVSVAQPRTFGVSASMRF